MALGSAALRHRLTFQLAHVPREVINRPFVPSETLGAMLRRLREEAEMTSNELADAAMISRGWISATENDKGTPSREALLRVADALDTDAYPILRAGGRLRPGDRPAGSPQEPVVRALRSAPLASEVRDAFITLYKRARGL
jgi:transcriptional regulator with XRE-family HTH domain